MERVTGMNTPGEKPISPSLSLALAPREALPTPQGPGEHKPAQLAGQISPSRKRKRGSSGLREGPESCQPSSPPRRLLKHLQRSRQRWSTAFFEAGRATTACVSALSGSIQAPAQPHQHPGGCQGYRRQADSSTVASSSSPPSCCAGNASTTPTGSV